MVVCAACVFCSMVGSAATLSLLLGLALLSLTTPATRTRLSLALNCHHLTAERQAVIRLEGGRMGQNSVDDVWYLESWAAAGAGDHGRPPAIHKTLAADEYFHSGLLPNHPAATYAGTTVPSERKEKKSLCMQDSSTICTPQAIIAFSTRCPRVARTCFWIIQAVSRWSCPLLLMMVLCCPYGGDVG